MFLNKYSQHPLIDANIQQFHWKEKARRGNEGEGGNSNDVDRENVSYHSFEQVNHYGFSESRVSAVQPMVLYTGLGGGIDPRRGEH